MREARRVDGNPHVPYADWREWHNLIDEVLRSTFLPHAQCVHGLSRHQGNTLLPLATDLTCRPSIKPGANTHARGSLRGNGRRPSWKERTSHCGGRLNERFQVAINPRED